MPITWFEAVPRITTIYTEQPERMWSMSEVVPHEAIAGELVESEAVPHEAIADELVKRIVD